MSRRAKSTEVETSTGRFVDIDDPKAETIDLADIAHGLAATCRFGGQTIDFYSVAEHAVLVSNRCEQQGEPRDVQYAALHHDDAEAYLGDIPRPFKPLLGQKYVWLSKRMDAVIGEHLGIDPEAFHTKAIEQADRWAVYVEARHLLPSQGRDWKRYWEPGQRIVTPTFWNGALPPRQAKMLYLKRHRELTDG